jgi:hypothetical protein
MGKRTVINRLYYIGELHERLWRPFFRPREGCLSGIVELTKKRGWMIKLIFFPWNEGNRIHHLDGDVAVVEAD